MVGSGPSSPHTPCVSTSCRFARARHELSEDQRVAPRRVPQGGRRRRFNRAAERQRQQPVDIGRGQVVEIDADEVSAAEQVVHEAAAPFSRPDGGDEEDASCVEQLAEQCQRGGVETRDVVDDQHEPPVARPVAERRGDGGEQRHRVGAYVDDLTRQEMSQGAERCGSRSRARGGSPRPPPSAGRRRDHFRCQPRLPDAGRTVDDRARDVGRHDCVLDHTDLILAADQGPSGRHTRTVAPTRARDQRRRRSLAMCVIWISSVPA